VVAHIQYGELDRKTFKPLEELVEIQGLAAGKAAHVKAPIWLISTSPPFASIPITPRNGVRLTRSLSITRFSSTHPPLASFARQDEANDFFIDSLA